MAELEIGGMYAYGRDLVVVLSLGMGPDGNMALVYLYGGSSRRHFTVPMSALCN